MVIFHWLFLLASYPDPGSVIKPEQLNLSKKTWPSLNSTVLDNKHPY